MNISQDGLLYIAIDLMDHPYFKAFKHTEVALNSGTSKYCLEYLLHQNNL